MTAHKCREQRNRRRGAYSEATQRPVMEASIFWKYTGWLNIIFSALAGLVTGRFSQRGAPAMLRIINRPAHSRQAGSGSVSVIGEHGCNLEPDRAAGSYVGVR